MPLPSGLFGAHVRRCSSHLARLTDILIFECQPKVRQMGSARIVNENIGGFDVPMHQTMQMGIVKCFGDRGHQFGRIPY